MYVLVRKTTEEDVMLSQTITINDADTKTLPTVRVDIVPAPGAGKFILPIRAAVVSYQVQPYENVTVSVNTRFDFSVDGYGLYSLVGADSLLTFGVDCILPGSPTNDLASTSSVDVFETFENLPLTVYINNADGNLTGGDSGNSLKVTVFYVVVDL